MMGGFAEYASYDALRLAALVTVGKVSAQRCWKRRLLVSRRNPAVNAVVMEYWVRVDSKMAWRAPQWALRCPI